MEDTILSDISNNRYTTTLNGDVARASGGYVGTYAATYDGTGDYLYIADDAGQDMAGDFTIDFFFKMDASIGTAARMAQTRDINVQGYGWDFLMNEHTTGGVKQPQLVIQDGTVSATPIYATTVNAEIDSVTLSTGIWYRFTVCRSGSTIKIYIDENQEDDGGVNSWTDSSTLETMTNGMSIGGVVGGGGWYGLLDHFRITNLDIRVNDVLPGIGT
jgi:hypothetical protein